MRMSRREYGLLLAVAGSAVFWLAVRAASVEVEVGRAALPSYDSVLNMVDKEIGTRVVERAKDEFDKRYARERDAASGKLSALQGRTGSAAELSAEADALAQKYQDEAVSYLRANVYATYFEQTYQDMIAQYTSFMDGYVGLQAKINDTEEKINQFKKLYNKARFMVSR